MENQPLFQILVGIAQEPRELDSTLDRIAQLKGTVLSVLSPLNSEDRLEFFLHYCRHEQKQWLQVCAKASRQRGIFDGYHTAVPEQKCLLPPTSDEAIPSVLQQAFSLLQQLRMEIYVTPSRFFEILKVPEYRKLMQFVTTDEEAEFRWQDRTKIQVPNVTVPKRTLLEGEHEITFRVHLVGAMEAVVEMPRTIRKILRPRGKKTTLVWGRQESTEVMETLYSMVRSGSSGSAIVKSIVDRSGHCVTLELRRLGVQG